MNKLDRNIGLRTAKSQLSAAAFFVTIMSKKSVLTDISDVILIMFLIKPLSRTLLSRICVVLSSGKIST